MHDDEQTGPQWLVMDHATISVGQWVSIPNETGLWQVESIDPAGKIGPVIRAQQLGIYFRAAWARSVVPVDDEHPPLGTAWVDAYGDVWRLTGWSTYDMTTERAAVTPEYKGLSTAGVFFTGDQLPDDAREIYRPQAEA